MAISVPSTGEGDQVVATINTTPLVDVMLVLLIIFLLTIPAVRFSVPVDLPKERNELRALKADDVVISVALDGRTYWHDTLIPDTTTLQAKLASVAKLRPQPEVQIRGDLQGEYDPIGRVLYAVQSAGIAKVGFITEPPARK